MARTPVLLALTCAALVAATALPAGAAAQTPCAPPSVDSFDVPANIRAGDAVEIGATTKGAATVVLDWGDGTSGPQGSVAPRHRYARAGDYRIVATATSACGARAAGATTVTVHPACAEAQDRSVAFDDCGEARAQVRVQAGSRRTNATPLAAAVCAETGVPAPVPAVPVPVARAACVVPVQEGPPKVAGRLRAYRGTTLTLRLGAPATRVSLALGTADKRQTPYVKAVREDDAGTVWSIRLAKRRSAATRLFVRVDRRGISGERFVAGLRVL